jgi:basic membrane protein A and related proteins
MTSTVILLAAASLLCAACGPSGDAGAGGAGKGRAALVIAQGGLGDQSYNDLANAGFQQALRRYGMTGAPVQSADIVAQGEQILRTAGRAKYNLVIDLEFTHAKAIGKVAKEYPQSHFAIINTEVPGKNVASVLFQEQEGSFLAGALAALMTKRSGNPKINPEKVIGVIGGTKSVGIDKFLAGYIQGARHVDPGVRVLTAYSNDFGDPGKGKQLAESMFQQKADIVYQVAGGTGTGIIQAAKNTNHYAIGVDADQDDLAPGSVLTTMIKHTDLAVETLIKNETEGAFPGGKTLTLGLKDGGVSLSEFRHTKQDIPAEYFAQIDQLKDDITTGRLKVWNVVTQGYPSWFKD